MRKLKEKLSGKKTYIVCAIAILTNLLAFANGEINIWQLLQAIFAALGGACLRAGVAKTSKTHKG